MKRILWKNGKICSLQLRDNTYVLFQMLEKDKIAVFNHFRSTDTWNDLTLTESDILFTANILKAVIQRSNISIHKNIKPIENLEYDFKAYRIFAGTSIRSFVFWEGTSDEIKFNTWGGGDKMGIHQAYREGDEFIENFTPIKPSEYNKYKHLESAGSRNYPEFNERLYLCSKLNKNVDPHKEMLFDCPTPKLYKDYLSMKFNKDKQRELGYDV